MTPVVPPVLSIRELSVAAARRRILENVSFDLYEGEILSIVGPSGSGKSTLLRAINRLADLENGLRVAGTVRYRGKDIRSAFPVHQLRARIGMVFQKPCMFPGSILHNVLFGARHHRRFGRGEAIHLAEAMLRKSSLWNEVKDRLEHPAVELSLGQKQRLSLARILAVDPDVLLLDEPTSSLDSRSTEQIECTLMELRRTTPMLLVTHLLPQAQRLSHRMLRLSALDGVGRVAGEGSAETILAGLRVRAIEELPVQDLA